LQLQCTESRLLYNKSLFLFILQDISELIRPRIAQILISNSIQFGNKKSGFLTDSVDQYMLGYTVFCGGGAYGA